MRRVIIIIGLFCLAGWAALPASAQDYKKIREELSEKQRNTRAEIRKLEEQIKDFEQSLELTREKFDSLYKQYEDLNRLLALQDQKLSKLQEEQRHLNEEIDVTEKLIAETRRQLEKLIENYKRTLSYVYKHGRTSQLALIFSAGSINQMLVRAHYLNEFDEYRQEQARQIREKQEELERTRKQLAADKVQNDSLLAEIRQEKEVLAERTEQQKQNVELLRRDKNRLQDKIAQKKMEMDKLENVLASITLERDKVRKAMEMRIRQEEERRKRNLAQAQEIEDPEEREKAIAKYSEPVENASASVEENMSSIENAFEEARGNLPWPVESRTISEHFGQRRHPIHGTVIPKRGIEIVTQSREEVRVIHDGYVAIISPVPGYGDVVVVSHGKYVTAYGNLSEVTVKSDTFLRKGDVIGLSGGEHSPKGQTLFFLIKEEKTTLDPEEWLADTDPNT